MAKVDELTRARAASLWLALDKNKQTGVRFGLFPIEDMAKVEQEGFDPRQICIALMDCAQNNGGMRS